jgi:dipeptidase E
VKLILISDLEKLLSNVEHFGEVLTISQSNRSKLLFIPSSPLDKAITQKNALKILKIFKEHGICFQTNDVLDFDADIAEIKKNINSYSVIFLMGGDTKTQNTFLHGIQLREALHHYIGIIIGMSAGAINLCENAFLNKKHDYGKSSLLMQGMGLLNNVSVDVHFDINDPEQIKELSLSKFPVYCIPDESALILSETVTCINDIYTYQGGIIKRIDSNLPT